MEDKFTIQPNSFYVCRGDSSELERKISTPDERVRPVQVKYMSNGKWAVSTESGNCWNKYDKCFDYEPLPSGRDASYLDSHRYDNLEDAIDGAKEAYVYEEEKYAELLEKWAIKSEEQNYC